MDCWRLARNLLFFLIGILLPLLAFQSAFADDCYTVQDEFENVGNGTFRMGTGSYSGNLYVQNGTSTLATNSGEWDGFLSDYPKITYPYSNQMWIEYWIVISQDGSTVYVDKKVAKYVYVTNTFEVCPIEPDTCSNAVQDPDEDGFNCGGPCASECDSLACPQDMHPSADGCAPDDENDVIKKGDAYGSCPDGTVVVPGQMSNVSNPDCVSASLLTDDAGACQGGLVVSAVMYYGTSICGPKSVVYSSDDPIPDLDYTPPDVSEFEKGSLSVVDDSSSSMVDNGDGTSTTTIVNTKTTTNNTTNTSSSSSSTTTQIIDNDDGKVLSESTVSSEDIAVEDNPENYAFSGTVPGPNVYDSELGEDMPEKNSIIEMVEGYVDQLPIMGALDGVSISTELTTCNMYIGEVWGKDLSIDMCRWQSILEALGTVLLVIAQIYALYIIIGGLRK